MAFKLPERDGIGKISAVIQLVVFAALFLTIYLLLRRVVHSVLLRILILAADYFIVSLFTYVVIRPLMTRMEEAFRKKK